MLPQDFEEIIMRHERNTLQDRQWLEKRFVPVFDDAEAAEKEFQKNEIAQNRLAEEMERLQILLES